MTLSFFAQTPTLASAPSVGGIIAGVLGIIFGAASTYAGVSGWREDKANNSKPETFMGMSWNLRLAVVGFLAIIFGLVIGISSL